jgi:hypothetical protein
MQQQPSLGDYASTLFAVIVSLQRQQLGSPSVLCTMLAIVYRHQSKELEL